MIDLPDGVGFADADWDLTTPFQDNRSGWTGARRGAGGPGVAHWYATATFAGIGLGHVAAAPIRAFLAKLRGSVNAFRFPVAKNQHPLSIAPTVKAGAVAGASQMTIKDLPISTAILAEGFYITVIRPSGKGQMLLLTTPLVSNPSGEATVQFYPPLMAAPAAGSPVETKDPWCQVTLVESRVGWKHGKNEAHSFRPLLLEEDV